MLKRSYLIPPLALVSSIYLLSGCGMKTSSSSGNADNGLRAKAWAPSASPLDVGAVFDVTPQVAVQPNGGGGAVAVWTKRVDLDASDSLPAVYHLYAAHWTGGVLDTTDTACPFGNPDPTGNDGVCVIDTGSAQYDAWSPKVSMDDNGDAIVVWQQHDGTAQRVYARRFSGGIWGAVQQLNDSGEFTNFDAADPAIALEPDPANNGVPPSGGTADDGVGSAMAVWSQYNQKDWIQVFDSTAANPTPKTPGAASGTNWTATPSGTLTNAVQTAADGFYATYNNTTQDDLCVTGFNFNITATSIQGIIVSVQGNGASGTATDRQYRIGLTKSGCTLVGTRKTGIQMSQTTDTGTVTGNLNDLWGTIWTPSDIGAPSSPNPSFGVLISDNDTTAAPLNIDRIRITVMTDQGPQCPGGGNNNCSQVLTMEGVYNGELFAGMGGIQRGSSDIYVYDAGTNTWSYSFNDDDPTNGYEEVRSMAVYNGKLYAGLGASITNNSEGDMRVFDGTAWTPLTTNNLSCGGGSPPCANVGGAAIYNDVRSIAVYQCPACPTPSLYIGMGHGTGTVGTPGKGDIWRCAVCDGSDWQMVWKSPVFPNPGFYGAIDSMAVYQCSTCAAPQLYAGFGDGNIISSVTTADVKRCTICDGSDWVTVRDNSATYGAVDSMAVYNGRLYIGYGEDVQSVTAAHGDIESCSICGGNSDWTNVFTGSDYPENFAGVNTMVPYNGFLYIGLGDPSGGTRSSGDIKRCIACDKTDWSDSHDFNTYDSVHSLAVYDGDLYAGLGNTFDTGGDIYKFSAGWQTVVRRLVNGVWDTSDTICPAGSGLNDGICYLSGVDSSTVQPSQSPRVKVDNFGRSIVAFIQMVQQTDCFVPPTVDPSTFDGGVTGDVNNLTIQQGPCMVSSLQANLFNGTSWQSPMDLSPDANLSSGTPGSVASRNQLICFEAGDGGAPSRGTVSNSDSCVNIVEFDLAMDTTGQTFLLIKTSWGLSEDFSISNPLGAGCASGAHNGNCNPDGNADQYYEGQAIVAREYGMGSPWSAVNWTMDILANFGSYPVLTIPDGVNTVSTPTVFGTGPFAGGCPSSTSLDGVRSILNCQFRNPHIAMASNGAGYAITTYESYDGSGWNIWAHYFISPWLAGQEIDAGSGDAHAPQIVMDAAGNGVEVWTQNDGAMFRIYSNCFALSTGPGPCGNVSVPGWQGAVIIDGGVGSESAYYSPVIDMPATGGAGSALSVFLGWSSPLVSGDNNTRLYYTAGP
ncbi:MAG TPA: hypothetical protein VLY20_07000 [Nitrospiria bacterium]|nr:hypothetical protein [Nitrospiria bacterium]